MLAGDTLSHSSSCKAWHECWSASLVRLVVGWQKMKRIGGFWQFVFVQIGSNTAVGGGGQKIAEMGFVFDSPLTRTRGWRGCWVCPASILQDDVNS